jgi:arginine/ornithine transport system permease protein
MWHGIDLALVWRSLPELGQGLVVTIELSLLTMIAGVMLSVPLGMARASRHRLLAGSIWVYTYFFRGTPMLIQLFMIYYGLAQFPDVRGSFLWPVLREGFWCAVIAFTLNTVAYTTEIIASAIRNVPHADLEAGRALGMSPWLLQRRVVLPVALRTLFPAYTNEVIFVLQSTSLASLVTVLDLTGMARVVIARTWSPYELFVTIGIVYLLLTYGMVWCFARVERRLYRHLKREGVAAAVDLRLR